MTLMKMPLQIRLAGVAGGYLLSGMHVILVRIDTNALCVLGFGIVFVTEALWTPARAARAPVGVSVFCLCGYTLRGLDLFFKGLSLDVGRGVDEGLHDCGY